MGLDAALAHAVGAVAVREVHAVAAPARHREDHQARQLDALVASAWARRASATDADDHLAERVDPIAQGGGQYLAQFGRG